MKRIKLTLGLILLTGVRCAWAQESVEIQWVEIPGGKFTMGADDVSHAQPRHEVTIKTFSMAKTLVTNKQYKACVAAGACAAAHVLDGGCFVYDEQDPFGKGNLPDSFQGDDQPAVCVDWGQAKAFARWAGGRLPTESEWEYAAQSGGKDQKYPWGNEDATCANAVISRCGYTATAPVCSKPGGNTQQGLCDMAGNAGEWVEDFWHDPYNGAPADGSAWENGSTRIFRVTRGGSWSYGADGARSAYRGLVVPDEPHDDLSFRLARSPTPAAPASPGSSGGADVNAKDKDGNTALTLAAGKGDAEKVRALIAAGADVNAKDKDSYTPLMWAAKGDAKIVKALIAAGAKVEAKTNDGTTALMTAGLSGDPANIKALIAAGANVNAKCIDGRTPLMWAASKGGAKSVKALIAAGAKVKAKTNEGTTALMMAGLSGDPASIKALIAAGSDVTAKDNDGKTPLIWAASKGGAEGVKALIAAGAKAEEKTNDGTTALMMAGLSGDPASINALIAAGADVKARTNGGLTALMWAASQGGAEGVKALIAAGADVNAKADDGATARDLAASGHGDAESVKSVIAALEAAGATR